MILYDLVKYLKIVRKLKLVNLVAQGAEKITQVALRFASPYSTNQRIFIQGHLDT